MAYYGGMAVNTWSLFSEVAAVGTPVKNVFLLSLIFSSATCCGAAPRLVVATAIAGAGAPVPYAGGRGMDARVASAFSGSRVRSLFDMASLAVARNIVERCSAGAPADAVVADVLRPRDGLHVPSDVCEKIRQTHLHAYAWRTRVTEHTITVPPFELREGSASRSQDPTLRILKCLCMSCNGEVVVANVSEIPLEGYDGARGRGYRDHFYIFDGFTSASRGVYTTTPLACAPLATVHDLSPSGERLVVGRNAYTVDGRKSRGGLVSVVDTRNAQEIRSFHVLAMASVGSVFSYLLANGHEAVAAYDNGLISTWDLENGALLSRVDYRYRHQSDDYKISGTPWCTLSDGRIVTSLVQNGPATGIPRLVYGIVSTRTRERPDPLPICSTQEFPCCRGREDAEPHVLGHGRYLALMPRRAMGSTGVCVHDMFTAENKHIDVPEATAFFSTQGPYILAWRRRDKDGPSHILIDSSTGHRVLNLWCHPATTDLRVATSEQCIAMAAITGSWPGYITVLRDPLLDAIDAYAKKSHGQRAYSCEVR